MKSFLALSGAILALSSAAFADYNTDSIAGPVTCSGPGLLVTINARRTQFTVRSRNQVRVYTVTRRGGDGDTRITREGVMQFGRIVSRAELSLDDQGDK